MQGIRFVTDDRGRKVAVQIDLKKHGDAWEEFYDQLVAEERANDKRIPPSELRKLLVKADKQKEKSWGQT